MKKCNQMKKEIYDSKRKENPIQDNLDNIYKSKIWNTERISTNYGSIRIL